MTRRAATLLALAGAALMVAACGSPALDIGPAAELGFVQYTDAVEFPAVGDWVSPGEGLRDLVPLGDCVLATGSFANGYRYVGASNRDLWVRN